MKLHVFNIFYSNVFYLELKITSSLFESISQELPDLSQIIFLTLKASELSKKYFSHKDQE